MEKSKEVSKKQRLWQKLRWLFVSAFIISILFSLPFIYTQSFIWINYQAAFALMPPAYPDSRLLTDGESSYMLGAEDCCNLKLWAYCTNVDLDELKVFFESYFDTFGEEFRIEEFEPGFRDQFGLNYLAIVQSESPNMFGLFPTSVYPPSLDLLLTENNPKCETGAFYSIYISYYGE
jgi:hypothetical protein